MTQTNTQLVPENWQYQVSNCLATSIMGSNDFYYVFIADHTDHANAQLQPLVDTIGNTLVQAYRNMIEGKYVAANSVSQVIQNIPYKSNFMYTMYDDQVELEGLPYYAIVNASAFYHVFKCLDNNMGANSTYQPNFGDISGANTTLYQTSDGYVWKYMYTATSAQVSQFGTAAFFPCVPNSQVTASAVGGSVSVIFITNPGTNYNNYITGTFKGSDLRTGGVPTIYQISNVSASSVNGFYTGCLLYLNSGTGMGQFANVIDYFTNSTGNFISIDLAFTTNPLNGTTYQIYPSVKIVGQGTQTINAIAMALINATASNSVYHVQMIQTGQGYEYLTANVIANSVVGVLTPAQLRPIYSPPGGHGYNAAKELGSNSLSVSVSFQNNETNTILTTNKFQQVGLLRNPLFANVNLTLSNVAGLFLSSEIIYKILPIRLVTDATVSVTNTTIQANDGIFLNAFKPGNFVYISANNGNQNALLTINTVSNNTFMSLTQNCYFSSNAASIYLVQLLSNAVVSNVLSSSNILCTNVTAPVATGDLLIGATSGTVATVNVVSRGGVPKTFNTFVQLHKYTGALTFRTFAPNEVVYQGNLQTANALLHSTIVVNGAITMYTSNQVGVFNNTIIGNTSGAIMTVSNAYGGELVYGSGDVVYLENINLVVLQNGQSEQFQIIWDF